jgi:hypothetical protein
MCLRRAPRWTGLIYGHKGDLQISEDLLFRLIFFLNFPLYLQLHKEVSDTAVSSIEDVNGI